MSLFEDIHLLICIVALIYLFGRIKQATQSRVLGICVAAFIVFFIFFQHVWIAFIFFFVMFGYMFIGGLTSGIMEGTMSRAYMGYLGSWGKGNNSNVITTMPSPQFGAGTSSWFKDGKGLQG